MPANDAPDPNAFRDFEHAGWEVNVSEYEDAFARLTSQAIGPLLDAVDLRNGAGCSMSRPDRAMLRPQRLRAERGSWASIFPLRWLRVPV